MNIDYAIFYSFFTFLITISILPRLIKKMVAANICGVDVNKIDKPKFLKWEELLEFLVLLWGLLCLE